MTVFENLGPAEGQIGGSRGDLARFDPFGGTFGQIPGYLTLKRGPILHDPLKKVTFGGGGVSHYGHL